MRRADRLFQIVQFLRARRVTTARQLAERLQVSERTIYRDIDGLSASGVPVEGEPGVGYRLLRGFEVPPIMFTLAEVEALVVGLRMAETWAGDELAAASRSALAKVTLALPAHRHGEIERTRLFAKNLRPDGRVARLLDDVRRAISETRRIHFHYVDAEERRTSRVVRPLGLFYWGPSWTLAAWCETRQGFRNFRLERVSALALGDAFEPTPGQSLDAFLAAMRGRPLR